MKKQPSPFNTKFNEASERVKELAKEQQKGKEKNPQSGLEVSSQSDLDTKKQIAEEVKVLDEKSKEKGIFTDKTSIYFSPAQSEKLALLAIQYKKQTGKRISTNDIIRILVDRMTIDDILI
jgi:hypothetical protein